MIAEQLQAARSAHWRQNQSPLLTLEDAETWCRQHPLCLFLPRGAQLPAPAPSFVEACVGLRQNAPQRAAIEQAQGLLTRLVASGTVVALNLFGTVSEQPDFLAHRDALPFVLSLRADADWKHAPQKSSGHKVSPLVLELWKSLEEAGARTAAEARESLGRELTEAAVLRALCELWQALRISPVYGETLSDPARWEMMRVHHREALTTAGATSQVTALSLLVSMYLQSVYAATSEEIEVFLSPVASRSRVREAVRGLSATRQIQSLSMDAQTYHFLENGLPAFADMPAAEGQAAPAPPAEGERRRPRPAPRKVQATRPPAAAAPPITDFILPRSASEPIFRRPKPTPEAEPTPIAKPEFRPAPRRTAGSGPRPGTRTGTGRPPARAGWPGSDRPAARKSSSPPTRAARPGGARPDTRDRARPAFGAGARPASRSGARPEFRGGARSDARPNARPYTRKPASDRDAARPERTPYSKPAGANPGGPIPGGPNLGARPEARGGSRPPARSGARPNTRPGSWAGAGKRDQPKPWALPGRKSPSSPRPPRPGGRGDGPSRPPFRPGRPAFDRPAAGTGPAGPDTRQTGGDAFRPRAPRSDRAPSAGRPASPYGAKRSFTPRAPGGATGRPDAGKPAGGRPPFRPAGQRPAAAGRTGPPRGADRGPRFDRPNRSTFAKPGSRPDAPAGDRRPSAPRPRPTGTGAGRPPYGRSGPGKSGAGKSGPGRPGPGKSPSSGRSGPRKPPSSGKPGRPSSRFGGGKPDRKKPEA